MPKVALILDRVWSAAVRRWRNYLFYAKTGQHVNLVGSITLLNRNLQCGRNVTIYPGVMLWGDGEIIIGNNVNIGKDTIIYSSKAGG